MSAALALLVPSPRGASKGPSARHPAHRESTRQQRQEFRNLTRARTLLPQTIAPSRESHPPCERLRRESYGDQERSRFRKTQELRGPKKVIRSFGASTKSARRSDISHKMSFAFRIHRRRKQ